MADWFQFRGIKSTSKGVYALTYPPLTLPEERVEFVKVPGRSGSLTVTQGEVVYDDITLAIDCMVKDMDQIDEVAAWLRGDGDLVLGNMPSYYYKARVVNQIEFTKIVRGRQNRIFSAVFRCQPFRYMYPAPLPIIRYAPDNIYNPGSVYAEPRITLYGNGDIALLVGANTLLLSGVSEHIVIDSAAGMACKTLGAGQIAGQSEKLSGDWPTFNVGYTPISWTGAVQRLDIEPNWRWL